MAPKAAAFLNSAWSGVAIDGGLRTGFALNHARNWENEKYVKEDCKLALQDEDAIKKIQTASDSIKRGNSELIYQLNGQLERKIKHIGLHSQYEARKKWTPSMPQTKSDR